MTTVELQKRSEKAQNLRVIQVDETWFYVESDEQKICYKVFFVDENQCSCTCGDFARGIKNDQSFKCKHILAVMSCVPNGEQEKAQFLERRKPKLDERFITTIENKDFVLYAGLLDLGHQKGILKIDVEPLQLPTAENGHMAICKATVLSKSGEVFTDVGDANPQNCHPRVAKHLLRMASTRAIARALRSMTNVGMTALEEISDFGRSSTSTRIGIQESFPRQDPKRLPKWRRRRSSPSPRSRSRLHRQLRLIPLRAKLPLHPRATATGHLRRRKLMAMATDEASPSRRPLPRSPLPRQTPSPISLAEGGSLSRSSRRWPLIPSASRSSTCLRRMLLLSFGNSSNLHNQSRS